MLIYAAFPALKNVGAAFKKAALAFFPFILVLLFSTCLSAQTKNDPIGLIRQQVQEINNKKDLKKRVFNGEDFLEHATDGGGELTCYLDQGKPVKIVEWIGLSSCIHITEYYIQNNHLIFAYTRGKEFEYLTGSTTTTPKLTMECRFYFNQDKLIKYIPKGATRCGGAPGKEWSGNYLNECARYEKLLLGRK